MAENHSTTARTIKLLPLDVGFNIKAQDMPVVMPAGDRFLVEYLDADDQPTTFEGNRKETIDVLTDAGYMVVEGPKRRYPKARLAGLVTRDGRTVVDLDPSAADLLAIAVPKDWLADVDQIDTDDLPAVVRWVSSHEWSALVEESEKLAQYGGKLLSIDDCRVVEMADPNHPEMKYQYRLTPNKFLERRTVHRQEHPWQLLTASEWSAMQGVRGQWHPILDPLGV